YTALAPRLPGTAIALSPLAQLFVLTPLTFALARAISGPPVERSPTEDVAFRYDRIASVYDLGDCMMEMGFAKHRPSLFHGLDGKRILEVGVGTGKNISHYPATADVTAIDISERMLSRARDRAERLGRKDTRFELADVQALPFDQ